jgi:predicted nuclease of predicted toxin-antitoxin system
MISRLSILSLRLLVCKSESTSCLCSPNVYIKSQSDSKNQVKAMPTKILLDEMYAGLKEYFETLGYEVLTAQEAGLKSAKDRDIVEYAGKHNLILVTQDQKPAELAQLLGVKSVFISNLMIAKLVDEKIKQQF